VLPCSVEAQHAYVHAGCLQIFLDDFGYNLGVNVVLKRLLLLLFVGLDTRLVISVVAVACAFTNSLLLLRLRGDGIGLFLAAAW